ncbi:hypothetical protein D1007_45456 [Hordeum vulgare]|uniref:Predicted protein n=1 Tax=Hordeum vulgare subsp. vulgare TaxID=112509 RepID=F2D8D0_HORVV|nr:uncharacterized protein LOC123439475 [Hordeum vulgare subsp. vulgare]KAE8781301.1 hypothetical protein D1007_45456 [Hordeum vulgare]KAI5005157.1 hypothetical protein ZWY2020_032400 [Hordeum vulgare]BAJ91351.1 predicted protein [Hordeum vulgare subsp. vulgare]
MARTGAAAALFLLVCCLLVGSVPARRPVELPTQVVPAAVDRVATAEPLLAAAEAASPTKVYSVTEEEEVVVDPARQLPQIFRCGGVDMAVSEESLSFGGLGHPALKGEVMVHGPEQERPGEDSFSDTDSDSDSDEEDNESGIMAWLWRLARRF